MNLIPRKNIGGFQVYERDRKGAIGLLKYVVFDAANFERGEFARLPQAVKWCSSFQALNPPLRIAWATRSLSNGKITAWSRVHRTVFRKFTLCGVAIPHTKHILLNEGENDYQIKGGECQACNPKGAA